MRYISLILLCVLTAAAAKAQTYSYVYIQGDKQTPFYVKLEGEMLPRYGKNYCIIPRLETGVINIDILFQQNAYPAQHFVIKVPEHSSRGFYLTRKNGSFSLYDLQQQFYLQAGNSEADDHAPDRNETIAAPVETVTPAIATPIEKTEQKHTKPVQKTKPVKMVHKPVTPATPPPVTTSVATGQPNFMGDIELNNDHVVKPARAEDSADQAMQEAATRKADSVVNALKREDTAKELTTAQTDTVQPPVADTASASAIVNSDCPAPVSDDQFDTIYKKAMQFAEEEDRLDYLNGQMGNCYTTAQARILARSMDSDAARYTFLKKVFPRITDQSKFISLQNLLNSDQWRSHFMEIVNRKPE